MMAIHLIHSSNHTTESLATTWLLINKVRLTIFVCLLFYYLDSLLHFCRIFEGCGCHKQINLISPAHSHNWRIRSQILHYLTSIFWRYESFPLFFINHNEHCLVAYSNNYSCYSDERYWSNAHFIGWETIIRNVRLTCVGAHLCG